MITWINPFDQLPENSDKVLVVQESDDTVFTARFEADYGWIFETDKTHINMLPTSKKVRMWAHITGLKTQTPEP